MYSVIFCLGGWIAHVPTGAYILTTFYFRHGTVYYTSSTTGFCVLHAVLFSKLTAYLYFVIMYHVCSNPMWLKYTIVIQYITDNFISTLRVTVLQVHSYSSYVSVYHLCTAVPDHINCLHITYFEIYLLYTFTYMLAASFLINFFYHVHRKRMIILFIYYSILCRKHSNVDVYVLIISPLLVLLAGDIHVNPGPTDSFSDITFAILMFAVCLTTK